MKTSKINLILMLTSGIIVGIIGIYTGYPLDKFAYTLVIVLVLFYVLGSVLDFFFMKIVDAVREKEEAEKEAVEAGEEEEDISEDDLAEELGEEDFAEEDFGIEGEDFLDTGEGEVVSKEDD